MSLKDILKNEVSPLLIGIRSDLKEIVELIKKANAIRRK
jgi:hypothetical protein